MSPWGRAGFAIIAGFLLGFFLFIAIHVAPYHHP